MLITAQLVNQISTAIFNARFNTTKNEHFIQDNILVCKQITSTFNGVVVYIDNVYLGHVPNDILAILPDYPRLNLLIMEMFEGLAYRQAKRSAWVISSQIPKEEGEVEIENILIKISKLSIAPMMEIRITDGMQVLGLLTVSPDGSLEKALEEVTEIAISYFAKSILNGQLELHLGS
ncbi:hypothetical protein PQD71_gp250 [Kosakonia phage Kc263]|uniref:Uncharacterized protein n=1 Tax=Kosakonia phage Kc263 TaxID=2863194 RepID=A0AAE8BEL2_9CAUD|nr:hypothetical protein PQD71_gp250 [Kosakonia phage Kc263]QYN80076.1 hypothetical protein [Kosakonia phage Kc263]